MSFSPKMAFFAVVLFGVVMEVIGDYYLKRWSLENKPSLAALGLLIYFIGSIGWMASLRYESLSKAGTIFILLNFIMIALVGVLVFNEHLTLTQKIGLGLGALSIVLMETA